MKNQKDIQEFEKWCLGDGYEYEQNTIDYNTFKKELKTTPPHRAYDDQDLMNSFSQRVMTEINSGKIVSINLRSLSAYTVFSLDGRQLVDPCQSSNMMIQTNIDKIIIQESVHCSIKNLGVNSIEVRANTRNAKITLEECYSSKISISEGTGTDLEIDKSYIGSLEIGEGAIRTARINGGSIRTVRCPPPDSGNPFTGSISVSRDVSFPVTKDESRLFEGPQQYRNLRAHLEKLQNAPMANLFRSLEFRSERVEERGLTKYVNWIYGTFANFGTNPGAPLLWALGFSIVAGAYVFYFDQGAIGMPEEYYVGWRSTLISKSCFGTLGRSVILPLQSIVNPLGLFGTRQLVVAATVWGHLLLSVQGLASDFLIAMSIFGIRRRFKLS